MALELDSQTKTSEFDSNQLHDIFCPCAKSKFGLINDDWKTILIGFNLSNNL